MSVCVTVRTKNSLMPDIYLRHLMGEGEKIIVTSDEYPSVKFGNLKEAIRGIEVNEVEHGLEVRVCTFSSTADYRLFAKTIDALMSLTGAKAYLDDDDEQEIKDPLATFDDKWIEGEHEMGFDVTRAMIRNSGLHIVMYGMFCKFCIGPNLLSGFDIPLNGEIEHEVRDRFMEYLCSMQWYCSSMKDTSTRMVLPSPTGAPDEALTISMICIKDGQVNEFDYVSEAGLLGIMDMDDENEPPVLIPFREAWKVLPSKAFKPLDDVQFRREGEVTPDMVREMMRQARRLQPDDLLHRPIYPGAGFDEWQNTFILMWNPTISSVTLDEHVRCIKNMYTEYFNWSVWDHEKAKCGDRFFLVSVGEGHTGIVMSGVFDSHPYEAPDWSGKGRKTFYMDMIPNVILEPGFDHMITTEDLQKTIPTFDWTGGHSGRMLDKDEARKLESLWADFIRANADCIDGETINVNRHVTGIFGHFH